MHWKDIVGYEGYYQVSDSGEVRSLERVIVRSDGVSMVRKGRIHPQKENEDGYMVTRLSKDGVRKNIAVHRLVAMAFVSGYFEGAEVNHKDRNRQNNNASNLEWVSHRDNIAYTLAAGNHISQIRSMVGANNPNFGNRSLSRRYAADSAYALEKQSRKGAINGRALGVIMTSPDGLIRRFDYMGECAMYMITNGLTTATKPENMTAYISRAAKTGKQYCGCRFAFKQADCDIIQTIPCQD